MSMRDAPTAAIVNAEFGWRAIVRRGDSYEEVRVDRWGLVMTRNFDLRDFGLDGVVSGGAARLVPISLSGDRIDRVPGYVGVAEPGESIDDAAARITDAWRHGKA